MAMLSDSIRKAAEQYGVTKLLYTDRLLKSKLYGIVLLERLETNTFSRNLLSKKT